jgi:hypothetical protein
MPEGSTAARLCQAVSWLYILSNYCHPSSLLLLSLATLLLPLLLLLLLL